MPLIVLPPIRYRRPPAPFSEPMDQPPRSGGFTLYDTRSPLADAWADARLAEIRREVAEQQARLDRDRMMDARYCPAPSQSRAWAGVAVERRLSAAWSAFHAALRAAGVPS